MKFTYYVINESVTALTISLHFGYLCYFLYVAETCDSRLVVLEVS